MTGTALSESELIARLRSGDERAFADLVERHHATMLAVARHHVKTRAVAEEVVQEASIGVIKGLDRFAGRSSLKTWILRILVNTAKTRGVRESRSVPYSSLPEEPAVDPDRFRGAGDRYLGGWRAFPGDWSALPEEALTARETLQVAMAAIEALPTPSAPSSRCATCTAAGPRRSAPRWSSPTATSACCSTAPARRSAPRWRRISMREPVTPQGRLDT